MSHRKRRQKAPKSAPQKPPKKPKKKNKTPGSPRQVRTKKISPKRKFSAGYPCGHPAKNFGQALQILGKLAFWHGHAAQTSTKKLRSEKLRADFSLPKIAQKTKSENDVRKKGSFGKGVFSRDWHSLVQHSFHMQQRNDLRDFQGFPKGFLGEGGRSQ